MRHYHGLTVLQDVEVRVRVDPGTKRDRVEVSLAAPNRVNGAIFVAEALYPDQRVRLTPKQAWDLWSQLGEVLPHLQQDRIEAEGLQIPLPLNQGVGRDV